MYCFERQRHFDFSDDEKLLIPTKQPSEADLWGCRGVQMSPGAEVSGRQNLFKIGSSATGDDFFARQSICEVE